MARPGERAVPGEVTVLVRCDLGPTIGVGHLMRCLALAEELLARGVRVVCTVDPADLEGVPFAQRQLAARAVELVPRGPVEDPVTQLREVGADLAVIDSYRLPEAFYDAVREAVPTLAVVDGDPAGRPADLWLDQNIGAEQDDWPVPVGTTRLAGLRYALIRDDVLDAARRGAPEPDADADADGPPRVFAFFGGTDAMGAAEVLVPALLATDVPLDLRVIGATPAIRATLSGLDVLVASAPQARPTGAGVGSGDRPPLVEPGGPPGPTDVETITTQQVTVLPPTDRLAEEVAAADLVVSAAGTSSWELLSLGAACAVVAVADNQHTSYDRAVATGAVAGLGHLADVRRDPQPATDVLRALLTDPAERARLRAAASGLVDGRGRARVADALLALPG